MFKSLCNHDALVSIHTFDVYLCAAALLQEVILKVVYTDNISSVYLVYIDCRVVQ